MKWGTDGKAQAQSGSADRGAMVWVTGCGWQFLALVLLSLISGCDEAWDFGSELHAGVSVATEAEEADLRAIARREGISYEEAVRRYGWQDDLGRVLARISQDYPDDYASSALRDDRSRRG